MMIPARVHFCWIGTSLPWAYVFAILSAAERSELPEIILHHTDVLEDGAELRALRNASRVQLSRIDPLACLAETGRRLGVGGELVVLYQGLDSPVMRTDVLRAAILYLQGGVYLDLDTVTTASLLPLLDTPQFVGTEFIVWPHVVRASRSPIVWARHLILDLLRKILRRMPHGWRTFKRVEKFYFRGVNNAVMGAEANSSLLSEYLLQEVVDRYQQDDLIVEEPEVFYPLPPRISEQWFRIDRNARLDAVLSAKTRVVHWYASVRTKSRVALIDPKYVQEHRERQLYSALVCSCIRNLPDAA